MTTEPLSHLQRPPRPKTARANQGLRRSEGVIGLLFLSPWILGYLLLKVFPILTALWYSFTNFQMTRPDDVHFIGLANYLRLS